MILKNKILPAVAILGFLLACIVAARSQRAAPVAQPVTLPAQSPYATYLGGSGIIEASTDNIGIGTSLPGIIRKVHVRVGDRVKTGSVLFELDGREYRSALEVKRAKLLQAQAAVSEARASLQDYRTQFALMQNVKDNRAISMDEFEKRRNAERLATAKLESALAAVTAAEADLKAAEIDVERLLVRATSDGEILQVNVHPGEFAATGVLSTPLVRLGNLDDLHIRADIDENDAWRFRPGSKAAAYLRGNRDIKIDLDFVRVEPYITPKTSLTGSSTERVDTRVLQVIFKFERSNLPVYVGQQVDVFIETTETADASLSQEGLR
jgi:HlyD family secretion protein